MRAILALLILSLASAAAAQEPRCAARAPGDFTCALGARSFLVHVPAGLAPEQPAALVVDLHGLGSTAAGQRGISGWRAKADQLGAVAVWPQGLGNSWNAMGACCGPSNRDEVDDVAFLRAVVAAVAQAGAIDERHVFATGLSNGAFMTHTLACAAADVFTAAIPVSATLPSEADCKPARPIPVLAFHGTADRVVPFGTSVLGALGAPQSRAAWARILGADPDFGQDVTGNVVCRVHAGGRGLATGLCTIIGGQHVLYRSTRGATIPDMAVAFLRTIIPSMP